MACETVFRQELRRRGLRVTPQRELVLSALHEAATPVSAEELYNSVAARNPNVDLSTVYRTLGLLQELRLVSGYDSEGEARYELLSLHGPHMHLLCQSCGAIEGVPPDEARDFAASLAARFGFEVQVEQLVVPGLCQVCRARGELARPPWVRFVEPS
ncbi:MAG: Fur family transcriptional regulator [Anaerolineae bacterium]